MNDYYEVSLPLIYNPELLGGQRGGGKGWWIVAEGDDQLGKYLRKLYEFSSWKTKKLLRPAWKEHITIVRDETPTITDFGRFWEKWRRQTVHCVIVLKPETNDEYFWLPVFSEACLVLRRQLGLSGEPKIPLHLSFGHNE